MVDGRPMIVCSSNSTIHQSWSTDLDQSFFNRLLIFRIIIVVVIVFVVLIVLIVIIINGSFSTRRTITLIFLLLGMIFEASLLSDDLIAWYMRCFTLAQSQHDCRMFILRGSLYFVKVCSKLN